MSSTARTRRKIRLPNLPANVRRRWSPSLGWQFRAYVVVGGTHHAGPWRGNKNPDAPDASRAELVRYIDEASSDARRLRERARDASALQLITLEEAMNLWLERCEQKGRTRATIRYYVELFDRVGKLWHADLPLHDVGVPQVEALRRQLLKSNGKKRPMSPTRADKVLNGLGSVFRYALRRGHLAGPNPFDLVERFEALPREAPHFGAKQLEAVAQKLGEAGSTATPTALDIALTLFFSGCNVMGLARMRVQDFDQDERTLYVDEKRRQRRIPVSKPLAELLDAMSANLSPNDFLVPTPQRNGRRKKTEVPDEERRCYRIKGTLQRARKLVPDFGTAFRAHTFRHSSVEFLRSRGVDRAIRMAFFGHKARDMHGRYEHPPVDEIRQAVCSEFETMSHLLAPWRESRRQV